MATIHSVDWYIKTASKIQEEVIGASVYAISNAIQAKISERNIVLTFYYKTNKYHLSTSGAMVFFTNGKEASVIMKYVNSEVEKASEKANSINKVSTVAKPTVIAELKDKGTEACIKHILKKIEVAKALKGNDNAVVAMMINLSKELEQYL